MERKRFTTASVQFGLAGAARDKPRRQLIGQSFYPIGQIDMSFVTADSELQFDVGLSGDSRKLVYLVLEFGSAADNCWRVDGQAGKFERNLDSPLHQLEEGLGEMLEPIGTGGFLLFDRTALCWRRLQDAHSLAS